MPAGHKHAFASLRVLPVTAQEQDAPSKGAAAAPTLLWQGRTLTVGRSSAATLAVGAPLASRCSVVLRAVLSGAVWLTDCSRHGTLLLELPSGSCLRGSMTASQLDALPWEAASMMDPNASTQLTPGCATLVVVGLHRQDWLAGAREGMANELSAKGAVLLVYEQQQQGPPLSGDADVGDEPAALEQPPELAAALQRLPFACTPGGAAAPGGQKEQHHRSRRPTKERPLGQVFNIHQWVAAMHSKPENEPEPAKKVKKRVHFELEQGAAKGPAGEPARIRKARQTAPAVAGESRAPGALALATHTQKRRQGGKTAKLPNQQEGTKRLAAKPPISAGKKRVAAAGEEETTPEPAPAPRTVKRQRTGKLAASKAANQRQRPRAANGGQLASTAKAVEAAACKVSSPRAAGGGTAAAELGTDNHSKGSKRVRAASRLEIANGDANKEQASTAAPGRGMALSAPAAAAAVEGSVKLGSRIKFGVSTAAGLPKQQEAVQAADGKPPALTGTGEGAAALGEGSKALTTPAAASENRVPTAPAGGVVVVSSVKRGSSRSAAGTSAKPHVQRGVRGMLGKPTRKQQLITGAAGEL